MTKILLLWSDFKKRLNSKFVIPKSRNSQGNAQKTWGWMVGGWFAVRTDGRPGNLICPVPNNRYLIIDNMIVYYVLIWPIYYMFMRYRCVNHTIDQVPETQIPKFRRIVNKQIKVNITMHITDGCIICVLTHPEQSDDSPRTRYQWQKNNVNYE